MEDLVDMKLKVFRGKFKDEVSQIMKTNDSKETFKVPKIIETSNSAINVQMHNRSKSSHESGRDKNVKTSTSKRDENP